MTLLLATIFCGLVLSWNLSIMSVGAAMLLIALVFFGRRASHSVNPYYLFATTPLALLLYSSSVSGRFLPVLEIRTQLIAVAGAVAYFIGLLCVGSAGIRRSTAPFPRYNFWIVLALGLIPHALGIVNVGIPALAADVEAARGAYLLPVIGQFTIFLPLSVLIAFRERNRKRIVSAAVLNFALGFVVLAKFNILLAGIFFLFGYQGYGGKSLFKLRAFHLLLGAMIALPVVFASIFAIREDSPQTDFYWRSQVTFQSSLLDRYGDYTYLPYLYLTTPVSNFGYLTELRPEYTYGARTFFSLASVLQLDSFLSVEDKPIRIMPFNTHYYLSDFYVDFGAVGTVALSFMLGLLVKWSYVTALRRPDVLNEGVWICVGFASSLLFFSNHFTGLTYPLVALILFNGYRLVSRSHKVRARTPEYRTTV